MNKKCHKTFVEQSENSLSLNPKKFWDFVRRNRSHNAVPNIVSFDGVDSSCIQEIVNLFSKHFSSVYSSKSFIPNFQPLNLPFFDLPNNWYFTPNDVLLKLNSLKNVFSLGPDGIPGDFLYRIRYVIFCPLWSLFRRSLDESTFPDMWKIGSITPILKSGNPSLVTNYRPISILGHISKIFESLVLDSIQPSVNMILANEQHGFRPGRSTVTCNLSFSNYIHGSFKDGSQVDVVYTDFAKAFDSVNHEVLISILRASGFGDPILSWFNSFLLNRSQWVNMFNTKSDIFLSTSGVPQGEHLSPLLFSLFVNSACTSLKHSQLLCFADDMKFFLKIYSVDDCLKLQDDLNRFSAWAETLGHTLNVNKCRSMIFTRSRSPITYSYVLNGSCLISVDSSICDLGFTFTSSLSPRAHIDKITCKALKVLGFIKRISCEFKLTSSLKSIYCALVRPIVEYGSIVWDPQTADACFQLERVQRKFLCYMKHKLNVNCPPHDYTPLLHLINLSSLADRRRSHALAFLNKILSGSVDSPSLLALINFKVPVKCTRNTHTFFIPHCPTNYLQNEPINRMMKLANEDPSFLP
uniref:Putative RNA-directed DNA polymerase n=1 Tax=Schizaphis graminum TaxID=13262 RepID=A0A2S2NAB7_SCHGA